MDRVKRYLDKMVRTISQYSVKPDKQKYNNLQDLLAKTILSQTLPWHKPFMNKLTFTINVVPKGATSQTVTATISQEDASATSTFEITGFIPQT